MQAGTTMGIGLCVGLLVGAILGQKLLATPGLGALAGAALGLMGSIGLDRYKKK